MKIQIFSTRTRIMLLLGAVIPLIGLQFTPNKTTHDPFSFQEVKPYLNTPTIAPQYIQSTDDINLAYYAFVPNNMPKATIVFYHGGGIWSNGIYQHMAQSLAQHYDIATYLFDVRGHGNSQGLRGDAPTQEQVWQDIDTAINFVKSRHQDQPLFLAGHSSGGGLIANYSAWKKDKTVDGYLLLSPFLGSNSGTIKPDQKFVTKARTWVFIAYAITGLNYFNHLAAVYFNYPLWIREQDNNVLDHYTCAMAMATTPYNPQAIFENITTPFALFVGQEDEQFMPEKLVTYKDLAVKVKNLSSASIVKNANHLSIILQAPHLFAQAIEELNKQTATF